jgi:uncharacterized protein with HEPN domain
MDNEISRLDTIKDVYKQTYLTNLEFMEDKLTRINTQIEATAPGLKWEILTKQRDHYVREIESLDEKIEQVIGGIDTKIEQLEIRKREFEIQSKKELESFEYNMDKIKEALDRRNVGELFNILENVSNALIILRKDQVKDFS